MSCHGKFACIDIVHLTNAMTQNSHIEALICLLDDPDDYVYDHVKDQIISLGEEIIPFLESAWETSDFGLLFQTRVENIIHHIQFDSTQMRLQAWSASGSKDLLEGVLLVAEYQYPDLDGQSVRRQIEKIRQDIWLELNPNLTAYEEVKVINQVLFDILGFEGNKKNFHAPQNSYINNVIESKKGNPLTLSVLYIVIAEQLEIPIYGINLPNHFVVAYMDVNRVMEIVKPEVKSDGVMFYINPFSKGHIFNREEVIRFIKQLKLSPDPTYYLPCGNKDIVRRMLLNLIDSYAKLGYSDKENDVKKLLSSLE